MYSVNKNLIEEAWEKRELLNDALREYGIPV
jgi:hypothetical protein